MRAILQRVSNANVKVNDSIVGEIGHGLLVLVGFEEKDTETEYSWMIKKITNLRIFNDTNGVMNLSLKDVNGQILVVSQFTLYADARKGNRPSYSKASKPNKALKQYNKFLELLQNNFNEKIQTGVFGAEMNISLTNIGPTTIILENQ